MSKNSFQSFFRKPVHNKKHTMHTIFIFILVVVLGIIWSEKITKGMPPEMKKQVNKSPLGPIDWTGVGKNFVD